MANKLCATCGTVGPTKRVMKGSLLTEFVLWCFFLVPGVIYSIWRHSSVYHGCAKCGAANVIPLDSPMARKLLPEGYVEPLFPGHARKPMSPRTAWAILLLIIGAIGFEQVTKAGSVTR